MLGYIPPTWCLKERTFDSTGFSAEGTFISASAIANSGDLRTWTVHVLHTGRKAPSPDVADREKYGPTTSRMKKTKQNRGPLVTQAEKITAQLTLHKLRKPRSPDVTEKSAVDWYHRFRKVRHTWRHTDWEKCGPLMSEFDNSPIHLISHRLRTAQSTGRHRLRTAGLVS